MEETPFMVSVQRSGQLKHPSISTHRESVGRHQRCPPLLLLSCLPEDGCKHYRAEGGTTAGSKGLGQELKGHSGLLPRGL
jgi:hypothetical protein